MTADAPPGAAAAGTAAHQAESPRPDTPADSTGSSAAARFAAIGGDWLTEEAALIQRLLPQASLPPETAQAVATTAAEWVRRVREQQGRAHPLQALLQEYDLSSEEGVLLMCLAEALLRIPDADTAEALIADKLGGARWETHLGHSPSLFVNASTWALMLGGRLLRSDATRPPDATGAFRRLLARSTEGAIRRALRRAMQLMGEAFVMGRDIDQAQARAARDNSGERYSFDMLGEAALTAADAQRYLQRYEEAIDALGQASAQAPADWRQQPGISVKLSALHPRFEHSQRGRLMAELQPRLRALAQSARAAGIGLTVDAEEADRLEVSLELFEAVHRQLAETAGPPAAGAPARAWDGFGLAVQAYSRRAPAVIDWLEALARETGRGIAVRLVKGAYWDTEIKRAQEQGLPGYPVYTRKACTDVAWLACARRLLAARDCLYPQFATHNAHAIAAVRAMAGDETGYEYQRLHGMGEALFAAVRADQSVPVRVYAPVGAHADLLPYLVRRLLENGANTSFIHHVHDPDIAPEALVADPAETVRALDPVANPALPPPPEIYAPRRNAEGVNLADSAVLAELARALEVEAAAAPAAPESSGLRAVRDPADRRNTVGHWRPTPPAALPAMLDAAEDAQPDWNALGVQPRAEALLRAADLLEARRPAFLHLLIREAGKTLPDAVTEVREAVDFLRYYAGEALRLMAAPKPLPGPAGEHNELQLHGRGVFACISPWNFPLAIFTGQIAAALVAGNSVIAKPAEQTPLVAQKMLQLLCEAGVPKAVLHAALGDGRLGEALVSDPRLAGVAFTGSVATARAIQRKLAARDGPIAVLVAETGGQNALIADASALPEQLVRDAISGAFRSAGQRCSATRLLCLQEDIAEPVTEMLCGAMQELTLGDPARIDTDVGPVITPEAGEALEAHIQASRHRGRLLARTPLPPECAEGSFVAPALLAIDAVGELRREHFGPVLHLLRYPAGGLDAVVDAINATGYGLTLAVHSRIEAHWRRVCARARVGNCYVNRNQVGSVVGVQPFGGEGLSGTGPKAGGPHYLLRFVVERTLTVNTAAIGGDAQLLSRSGD